MLSTDAEYNQMGRLSYRIVTDGRAVTRYVDVPQNYSLEVEQLGAALPPARRPM